MSKVRLWDQARAPNSHLSDSYFFKHYLLFSYAFVSTSTQFALDPIKNVVAEELNDKRYLN